MVHGRDDHNVEKVLASTAVESRFIAHITHILPQLHLSTLLPQRCIILTFMPTATEILHTNKLSSLAFLFLQSTYADVLHIVMSTYRVELVGTFELGTTTFYAHGSLGVHASLSETTL